MKRTTKRVLALTLCAMALLGLCACKSEEQISAAVQSASGVRDVIYNEAPEEKMHTIIVKGNGQAKVLPDTASITFNINTKDKEAQEAQAKNDQIVQALTSALQSDGVAQKDIKTQSISMHEQYDYSKDEPVLTGYQASNRVQVTVRKVEDLGTLIAHALEVGVTSYDSLNFAAADTAAGYDEALKAAVQDAERKAAVIAEAAGRPLVGIVTIEEQSVSQSVRYDATNKMSNMVAEVAAMDDGPEVSTGELTMEANIVVTYELEK